MIGKDIVVHIGYPKTGSTTIQRWLGANTDVLSQAGVRYLNAGRLDRRTGEPRMIQHIWLREELRGKPAIKQGVRGFGAALVEIRKCAEQTIVLSSEQFTFLTARDLQKLVEILASVAGRIRIIGYLRDQDRYLESLYNTRLVRIDAPFDGDFPDLVDEQIAVEIIDYRARARMFAEVLGAENVSLASFGTSRTSGGALLDDFLSRIGCDPAIGAGGLPAQNASNDVRSIHIWRRLLVEKGLAEASDDARRAALRTLKQLQRNLGWGEAKPVFFTPSARHALLARYVEGNAEVNAQYGTELIDAEALDGKDYPASNWPPVGLLSAGEISAVRDAFGLDLSDLLA